MKSISFLIAFLYIIKTLSKEVSEEFSRKPSEDFIREWEGMMVNFTPEDIKTFMVHSYEVDVVLDRFLISFARIFIILRF